MYYSQIYGERGYEWYWTRRGKGNFREVKSINRGSEINSSITGPRGSREGNRGDKKGDRSEDSSNVK